MFPRQLYCFPSQNLRSEKQLHRLTNSNYLIQPPEKGIIQVKVVLQEIFLLLSMNYIYIYRLLVWIRGLLPFYLCYADVLCSLDSLLVLMAN